MVKFIIIFLSYFLLGCEINSQQLINKEKFSFDEVKFNTVSKNLSYNFDIINEDQLLISKIIDDWFNKKVKVNGFEGDLDIIVENFELKKILEDEYYKVMVKLDINFIEKHSDMNKKFVRVNSNEYGEIKGNFSIQDQENLNINVIHKSLLKINSQINNR